MADIEETRRSRLRDYIADHYEGNQTAFARSIEREPNYVSRVLKGKKGIGWEFCRYIEQAESLPDLWLDTPHDSEDLLLKGTDGELVAVLQVKTGDAAAARAVLDERPAPAQSGRVITADTIVDLIRGVLNSVDLAIDDVIPDVEDVRARAHSALTGEPLKKTITGEVPAKPRTRAVAVKLESGQLAIVAEKRKSQRKNAG